MKIEMDWRDLDHLTDALARSAAVADSYISRYKYAKRLVQVYEEYHVAKEAEASEEAV